ncbi:Protein farnesyltransferase/geranylgeranyltransferase type-1 subunit alpha [Entamoeba marina]
MEEEITFNPALYQDVTPIYVKTPPICSIDYSQTFRDAMAYYRALMQKNEISERALLLTGIIIDLNSADYSAWYYRRRILKAFQDTYDITKEYDFIESLGDNVSKNYQVWGHRQYIVGLTGDYLKELDFVNQMLEDDNKNYHCWSHRVWICNKFNCWAGELAYTQQMIDKDIRNNSAWSHRFFTLKHLGFFNDLEKLRIELGVIEKSLHSSANNEAVWTYLTGLYENALNEDFKVECKEFIQRMIDERQFSVYAKITYVNIFVNTPKVKEIVLELRDRLDVAHKNYWEWYLKFLSA